MITNLNEFTEDAVILWEVDEESLIVDGIRDETRWINLQQHDHIICIPKVLIPDLISILKQVKLKS